MSVVNRTLSDRDDVLAEIASGAADRERHGIDPHEQIELLKLSGLTALTLDRADGGAGAGVVELLDFVIDLARADPVVAHILRAHYWFVEQVRRLPADQVRDRWASRIADGAVFGNATSERTGTAGIQRFSTQLRPIDGGWLLSGEKFYSTGTAFADWVSVAASVHGPHRDQVARIVLPVSRAGVHVIDDWDGIGQHRTGTGSTTFSDVFVTSEDVLELADVDPDRATTRSGTARDGGDDRRGRARIAVGGPRRGRRCGGGFRGGTPRGDRRRTLRAGIPLGSTGQGARRRGRFAGGGGAVRGGRSVVGEPEPQPGPPLAQHPHDHFAQSDVVQSDRARRSIGERNLAAVERLFLTFDVGTSSLGAIPDGTARW